MHSPIRPIGHLLPRRGEGSIVGAILDFRPSPLALRLDQLAASYLPCLDDLLDRVFQADGNIPAWIVLPHFGQVAVVADVVADAVLVNIRINLITPREGRCQFKSLQNRATVVLATADVVDLGDSRSSDKRRNESGYVFAVNIVANLFALIPEDFVFPTFEVALHEIAEEAV